MIDVEDLIRRLKLSIAGFDRGEHVSSWVTWKLNQECVEQLEKLNCEGTMTEKDAERQFEIEASTMSREQIYNLAKRLAVELERWKEITAEEVGVNLEIAEEIGISQAIKDGKAYADAERDLFRSLRSEIETLRRELAEAGTIVRALLDADKEYGGPCDLNCGCADCRAQQWIAKKA